MNYFLILLLINQIINLGKKNNKKLKDFYQSQVHIFFHNNNNKTNNLQIKQN